MNTHERLLDVAKRLDELAGDLECDELVTLSNELAEIADVGGVEKTNPAPKDPERAEYERRLLDVFDHEMRRMIMRDPDLARQLMYRQNYLEQERYMAQRYASAPVLNPADFRKLTTP